MKDKAISKWQLLFSRARFNFCKPATLKALLYVLTAFCRVLEHADHLAKVIERLWK